MLLEEKRIRKVKCLWSGCPVDYTHVGTYPSMERGKGECTTNNPNGKAGALSLFLSRGSLV